MLPHLKYRTGWKWNKKFQGKEKSTIYEGCDQKNSLEGGGKGHY